MRISEPDGATSDGFESRTAPMTEFDPKQPVVSRKAAVREPPRRPQAYDPPRSGAMHSPGRQFSPVASTLAAFERVSRCRVNLLPCPRSSQKRAAIDLFRRTETPQRPTHRRLVRGGGVADRAGGKHGAATVRCDGWAASRHRHPAGNRLHPRVGLRLGI